MLFEEYQYILKYFWFSLFIVTLLFFISYFFVFQAAESEKNSSYECGFNPFGDARVKFEVRFYLVAILYIIFDLEISFLFPWVLSIHAISYVGIYSMYVFLLILTVGFFYEWVKGALEWE